MLSVANAAVKKPGKPTVIVLLHGVEGNAGLPYIQDTAASLVEAGHHVIMLNHFHMPGEKNLRVMNFVHNQTTDEVLAYARERYEDCDIYLVGFSLGGNHVLTYAGKAAKLRLEGKSSPNDQSEHVKAIVAISNPFDVLTTALKMQKTAGGFYDKYLWYKMHQAYENNAFNNPDGKRFPSKEHIWKNAFTVIGLDDITRAPDFGYESGY